MTSIIGKLALGAALLSVAPLTFANLLTNGSFESGNYVWNGNGAESLALGNTDMTGWTVVTAEVAGVENGDSYGLASEDGTNFVDLTGYHDSTPFGGVQQSVATVVGQSYSLTFWIGVDNSLGIYSGPVVVSASVDGNSANYTNSLTGAGNQWFQATDNFTATSTSTMITLTGISTAGGQYIGLDNVDVEATPEPMTFGLLGLGVVGLIARKRRV